MNDAPTTTKAWIKNLVVTQSIAIVAFVGVPILITLVASLTDIDFEHRENGIHARVTRYVLMYIPWKTEFVEDVTEVRASITPAKYYRGTSEERRKGQKGVRLETGQVIVAHADTEVHVDVDPKLAKEIEASFKQFQLDKSAAPIHFPAYASWWLSYVLGGVATGFCALYVVGAALAIVIFPFKLLKRNFQSSS